MASVFLVLVLFPAIALAQEVAAAEDPTALARLADEVMNVLVPVFVAFIGGLAAWLLKKAKDKFGIEVSDKAAASWSMLAQKAALRGAEWSRKKAKDLTAGQKVPGPEVLEVATSWAVDMAVALKLPDIGREKLMGLIEAELFAMRRAETLSPDAPPDRTI